MSKSGLNRSSVALLWAELVQIQRDQIFDFPGQHMPAVQQEDAAVLAPGLVGPTYEIGGAMILGGNPGGGTDAYTVCTPEDVQLYGSFRSLQAARSDADKIRAFEEMTRVWLEVQATHRVSLPVEATLRALGAGLPDVVFHNCVPFRTRNNVAPTVGTRRRAFELVLQPQLDLLKPGILISLGSVAGDTLRRFFSGDAHRFHVRRTNGDRYLHEEAVRELDRLEAFIR